jgi:hypothetical protein
MIRALLFDIACTYCCYILKTNYRACAIKHLLLYPAVAYIQPEK